MTELAKARVEGVEMRPYKYPATSKQYHADPSAPIDRWCQTDFSANAATVYQIVHDVYGRNPGGVLDPFCGAGSTAASARMMSVPFFGIDFDPIMVALTFLKSTLSMADIPLLGAQLPAEVTVDWLLSVDLRKISCCSAGAALACVLMGRNRREALTIFLQDMEKELWSSPDATVIYGDSTESPTWLGLARTEDVVIFTSPPFPGSLNKGLAGTLWNSVRLRLDGAFNSRPPEHALTAKGATRESPLSLALALKHAREVFGSYLAIVEHEDPSPSMTGLRHLLRTIRNLDGIEAKEVLKTQKFSALGVLFEVVVESTKG